MPQCYTHQAKISRKSRLILIPRSQNNTSFIEKNRELEGKSAIDRIRSENKKQEELKSGQKNIQKSIKKPTKAELVENMSLDSDDSDIETSTKKKELELKEKRIQEQFARMKLVEAVEHNEKSENMAVGNIEDTFAVFGENSQFDIPEEDRIMLYQKIQRQLSEQVFNSLSDNIYGLPQ